jgi:predicted kinase
MSPQLKILSGIPCSGKSTYIKTNCVGFEVISRDNIRDELFGKTYKPHSKKEDRITDVFMLQLLIQLDLKRNVVIDNTNVKEGYIDKFLNLMNENYPQYNIEIIFFDISLFKAKVRNILRYLKTGKWIPMNVMDVMYRNYNKLNRNKYLKYSKYFNIPSVHVGECMDLFPAPATPNAYIDRKIENNI